MYGTGVLRSLGVTLQHLVSRKITVRYPEQRPQLSPRLRGRHIFHLDLCIGCTLCERVCPVDAIYMEIHKDTVSRQIEVDRFAVDMGLCYFCGLCEDVCPTQTKALHMGPEFEMASYDRGSLVYEMDRLDGPYPEQVFRDAGWVVTAEAEARAFADMQGKTAKDRVRTPTAAVAPPAPAEAPPPRPGGDADAPGAPAGA